MTDDGRRTTVGQRLGAVNMSLLCGNGRSMSYTFCQILLADEFKE